MQAIYVGPLRPDQLEELDACYRTTASIRVGTRAQMMLLSAEHHLVPAAIAAIVRQDEQTVRRWIKRYQAEGLTGHADAPRPGGDSKIPPAYRAPLLEIVRRRPQSLNLPFSLWSAQRLADFLTDETGLRVCAETVRWTLKAGKIVLSRPQHKITSPDPEYQVKKRRLKRNVTT